MTPLALPAKPTSVSPLHPTYPTRLGGDDVRGGAPRRGGAVSPLEPPQASQVPSLCPVYHPRVPRSRLTRVLIRSASPERRPPSVRATRVDPAQHRPSRASIARDPSDPCRPSERPT